MAGQNIRCSVMTCRFNDSDHCSLHSITVGCEPGEGRPKCESDTICASFMHK